MKKRTKNSILKAGKTPKKILTGIELLSQGSYKLSFQRLAEHYVKKQIDFRMILGAGCFATYRADKSTPIINLDLKQFEKPSFSSSHYHIVGKGAVYHECGHLLYSDFKVFNQIINSIKDLAQQVKDIATKYHAADETDKPTIELQLRDRVFDYVYEANIPDVLNSFEDASIERSMSEFGKDENGCINFLRETAYQKDLNRKLQELNEIPLDEAEWDDKTFKFVLSEARAIACCGYKMKVDTKIIDALFEPLEKDKIYNLAQYCRFSAQNTGERCDAARVFLDVCKPIIEKIAEKLSDLYISNMEEAENKSQQMQQNANNHTNNTSGNSNQNNIGSGLPSGSGQQSTPRPQSKYNLELPDDLQEQINQAGQQRQSASNPNGQSDGNNPNGQAGDDESNDPIEKSIPTKKELSDEAENDMNEVIRNAEKTFQKQEEQATENIVMNHPEVRAGEGRCHKQKQLQFHDFQDSDEIFRGESDEGILAKKEILCQNIDSSVNILTKKMKKILMQKSQDNLSKGRLEGKIDSTGLYRIYTDLQVFEKKTLGQKNKIRFAILVDCSGSMSGSGLMNAILGSYMVSKAAQKLKIPFSVYGHNEWDSVHITKYIDYKNCKQKQSLDNLFYMQSCGANRDGLAIYHVCRELAKSAKPNEELYFIILSDGQPNGENYGGSEAIKDMQETMNFYKKHFQIHSIGIGLGLDFNYSKTVEKIYDNAVIVKTPDKLPNEMFKILKKILRMNK